MSRSRSKMENPAFLDSDQSVYESVRGSPRSMSQRRAHHLPTIHHAHTHAPRGVGVPQHVTHVHNGRVLGVTGVPGNVLPGTVVQVSGVPTSAGHTTTTTLFPDPSLPPLCPAHIAPQSRLPHGEPMYSCQAPRDHEHVYQCPGHRGDHRDHHLEHRDPREYGEHRLDPREHHMDPREHHMDPREHHRDPRDHRLESREHHRDPREHHRDPREHHRDPREHHRDPRDHKDPREHMDPREHRMDNHEHMDPREHRLDPREHHMDPREHHMDPREHHMDPREHHMDPREHSMDPRDHHLEHRDHRLDPALDNRPDYHYGGSDYSSTEPIYAQPHLYPREGGSGTPTLTYNNSRGSLRAAAAASATGTPAKYLVRTDSCGNSTSSSTLPTVSALLAREAAHTPPTPAHNTTPSLRSSARHAKGGATPTPAKLKRQGLFRAWKVKFMRGEGGRRRACLMLSGVLLLLLLVLGALAAVLYLTLGGGFIAFARTSPKVIEIT
ncbi:hypothetical protein OTU49_001380, partial [Cherax quadricarinatus]